ncbi:MAG: acylphosphatase [Candidatus Omnitrophica bacterium CG12_big_fil_rev_8_21_14_0_65_43_15]|uniref:acylphosphatase n=1 Tax=Candidatus Taenaricola geysiri TaxID=1974752 RepID=A0A2J0LG80_9BACT|nr:MAG: acylphosphatase [Candidatus Omnitrophica bacterium CG02_land_8_20_14_3_00__42_8]PIW66219.1 MAG: acylphosphatase [Candidatus Omnitrophica bacterium CG12_big_fil_rev_8_21_14_0_65_43_15]PIW80352.1 MAG: acylphosphatase [Candidatus Omnitrophica bacterium CG_4_8_14_3_um_filter_43_15]PIY83844.1 MAG: acylphosphatase [Candidatus Omnitrophica bacterium CG_4_10_14_0_8_um_filter_43_18]PJC45754.1 MAG: acylphosphatase [Candidatus Omnitrophica bacterium CG_4_9_14_0_2_um_filter_43_12]
MCSCEAPPLVFLSIGRSRTIPMKKRVHVYYSGRVQGVGFRFTAEDVARALGVCGWVRNLSDGKVEITAEAQEAALNDFLAKIREYFSAYIDDAEITWQEPSNEFKDFNIAI